MPITRSKSAAEERTLCTDEGLPASPSEPPRTATRVALEPTAIEPSSIVRPTHVSDVISPRRTTTEQAGASDRPIRAHSVRSQRSNASVLARIKQAEYEAEEQIAEIKLKLIQKKLAANVAAIQEDTDRESVAADETEHRVTDWLAQGERGNPGDLDRDLEARCRPMKDRTEEPYRTNTEPNRGVTFESTQRQRSPTPNRTSERGIERLADTIEKLALRRMPSRQSTDLPVFSGTLGEWLPFKASMEESTSLHRFSPAENIARLRVCLRGEARQTVSALLFTATDPAVIMRTLEQCYGRPQMIINQALEDIKKLPRLGATASELNSFAIKLQNIVTVISCLDNRGYLQNPMLTDQVIDKLTPHIISKWCDYAQNFSRPKEQEIVTLSRFLMEEADRAMRFSYAAAAPKTTATPRSQEQPRANNRKGKTVYATAEDEEKNKKPTQCFCCGAEHMTPQCSKLKAMSVDKRWEWAKEVKICFRCLNSKHRRFHCKNRLCGIAECRRPHHALLHAEESAPETTVAEESVVTAHASTDQNKVLLKVCPVIVKANDGTEMNTYALLDEGSTITLIDDQVAKIIGAHGPRKALNVIGVTSSNREPDSRMISMKIRGLNQESFHEISARTVKNLTLGRQSVEAQLLQQAHLRHLKPELVCYEQAKPRILIGADHWHLIVTRKLLTGRRNQPAASLTRLGWIIHGCTPVIAPSRRQTVLHLRLPQEEQSERDTELSKLVKAHYDIDALGVTIKRKPVATDERAKEIFERTAKRVDGRFEVGLPWTTDHVVLPPSYDMALRRLRSIERKIDKSAEFKIAYTAQINKLLEKGYAEKCNEDHEDHDRLWYLPHFAVTNPNKPNKIRLVFDAAAKANGTCLNDVLLDGPDLLQSLYGVLFRFRKKPIAVTADIREMFLRVTINPADRVAQHFLWREDAQAGPPQKYVMASMIFGARSSPFMAHSVRDRNAADHKESHPLAFNAITQNHYMDDWVDSFDTEQIAARTIAEVRQVHRAAGFELAGWSSNRDHLLKDIPGEDQAHAPKELAANAHIYGKTLGVLWMPKTDQLAFNTAMPRVPEDVKNRTRVPTKREALGAVMSLFDPLGLLSPYTITAKIMLQELWKNKIQWDEPLPPEEATIFEEWLADLKFIDLLRIPRCYYSKDDVISQQLHVLCDASEQAFAAVAFWRFETRSGIKLALVAGKAKVAPLKAQSIPRMELQASLIGARLATEIVKGHKLNHEVTLWSDSKTVLHWIRKDSAKYTPYVAHRLSEIAELTRPDQWRWVPTALNVADDATRSGNTRLRSNDRWFKGPTFLYETEDAWPTEEAEMNQEETLVAHAIERLPLIDIKRFSSYERLVRAIAYALAFIDKCRRRAKELETKHLLEAERLLWRESQKECFPDDLQRLLKGKNVNRTSRLYKLDPKYGEDRIIRLNSRINATTVPDHLKDPPILDGAHAMTRLLIRREHEKNHHIGREHIVNSLRQRYWILRLRTNVRAILHDCTLCKAKRANPAIPVKGDLPRARIDAHTRPFAHCGVDCFGPMWITIGRRREKRWGMLFTCLVVRAIHVELIASLSTDSAIMAIRRMAARRGVPALITSDNGTNFRGSDVELKNAFTDWLPALKDYAKMKQIEWKFIDPGAPNQGGAWERLIKSVKSSLAVTLKERAPKEEVLNTLITEIEHTVNSRPLTHVPVNPEDQEALTPNHFLLGSATGLPYVGECDVADRRTWRTSQALANMFWARWIKEYLPALAPRNDVRKNKDNVKPGDLVIIADGLLPRNVWPRGLVERVYTGPDGVVRSAEVRTRGGTFKRPVRRLVVLPIEKGCEDLRRGEDVADADP